MKYIHIPKKYVTNQNLNKKASKKVLWTWPTILTATRIVAIPILMGVFYIPIDWTVKNTIAAGLFVLFAITDWLDGYLARKLNQTSAFGAFLDPVADKFLVCASMLVLVDLQRVDVFIALIIVGRELAISALREWMAELGARSHVAVHWLGKFKTAAQMAAIGFLLFAGQLLQIGTWLMYIAAALTIWSMLYYLKQALPIIKSRI